MSSFDLRFRLPADHDMCGRCVGSGRGPSGQMCERCDGRGVLRRRRATQSSEVVADIATGEDDPVTRAVNAKARLLQAIANEIAESPSGQPLAVPGFLARWAPPVDPRWQARRAAWRERLEALRAWVTALDPAAPTTGEKLAAIVESWRSVPRVWLGLLHLKYTASLI
jgi:hypothetical protein